MYRTHWSIYCAKNRNNSYNMPCRFKLMLGLNHGEDAKSYFKNNEIFFISLWLFPVNSLAPLEKSYSVVLALRRCSKKKKHK